MTEPITIPPERREAALKYAAQIQALTPAPKNYCPNVPTERQELFLGLVDEREALYGGAAGGGKLLDVHTPVPTPAGWTAMGDLRAGDVVFSEAGTPATITHAFAPEIPSVSYRLTFDDGSYIDAGGEHLWVTFSAAELAALTRRDPAWREQRRAKRPSRATGLRSKAFTDSITARNKANAPESLKPPRGTVRTTTEIYQTLYTDKDRANHAVRVAGALVLPDADLPLDPYSLGAWLGDGSKSGGVFTGIDPQIWQQFELAGFAVSHSTRTRHFVRGLAKYLKQLGVLGNKHVPDAYLRGSKAQRLALLQGLMDTDGTVCDGGSVEFTNTNKAITDAVYQLITSLGWKARVIAGRATLNGKDCGTKWDIKWTPSEYVFRLERKRAKQRLTTRRTTKFRYIVACEIIEPMLMRCIAVDSPSHLYLAGRQMVPTHNSNALLADALRYVHIPNYSALLVRRTYADLSKPGALMDRAQQWLKKSDARWNGQDKQWRFPSGATLSFGYLDTENDKYHFQGAEFQYIGVDEITQFNESQYVYLFSRLRRLSTANIPVRMRAATNPGGVGGRWVHERFIPEGFMPEDAIEPRVHWKEGVTEDGRPFKRAFVPARLVDNPYLNQAEYEENLYELDPVTREQLLRGDWQITQRGDILTTYSEAHSVITWSQFANVFGTTSIPKHWLLGVYQDWGATPDHPCVTGWFATAGQNAGILNGVSMAGAVFLYRGLVLDTCTMREVAEHIKTSMATDGEIARTVRWQMSHEALSERLGYNKEHGLPFVAWETGKTRGITQLKTAFELREPDKQHPFKPGLMGHPNLYLIVDDAEYQNPKTDRGLARFRAEIPAYHWNVLKSGEPMTSLLPYALFNDAIDVCRAAAADYWPMAKRLSKPEQIEAMMPEEINREALAAAETDYDKTRIMVAQQIARKTIEYEQSRPPTRNPLRLKRWEMERKR